MCCNRNDYSDLTLSKKEDSFFDFNTADSLVCRTKWSNNGKLQWVTGHRKRKPLKVPHVISTSRIPRRAQQSHGVSFLFILIFGRLPVSFFSGAISQYKVSCFCPQTRMKSVLSPPKMRKTFRYWCDWHLSQEGSLSPAQAGVLLAWWKGKIWLTLV